MASVFAHLFDTLPFTCAMADMAANGLAGSPEHIRPDFMRQYFTYAGQAESVVEHPPTFNGYPHGDKRASHGDAPRLENQDRWAWSWLNEGTRVVDIDCRARGNGFKLQRVLDFVEFGRHESGREIIPEILVVDADDQEHRLELTPKFLHSKWGVRKGDMGKGFSKLWPLEANLDSAVVAAYAYDVYGKEITPYTRSAMDPGNRALESYHTTKDPLWIKEALSGGFMEKVPAIGSRTAGVNRDPAGFSLGEPRILVVLSFAVFKERADVEPGGLLGMTKVHPHIMVRSSLSLRRVDAAVRGHRPEKTTVTGPGDPNAPVACCHSKDDKVGALFVNDNNLVDADMPYNLPLLTFWSTVFGYIEVDPDKRLDGQMLTMVRRHIGQNRPTQSGATRVVPNLHHGKHVETDCVKIERQGEFDNIHMAPRLSLDDARSVVWFEDEARLPSKPYAIPDAERAHWHLDDIAMAPVCEHDCFHFHWRWLAGASSQWTRGWGKAGPHTEPGAAMVPLNQEVEVAIDTSHGWIYRASATPHDDALKYEGRTVIDAYEWQIFMHHGAAYAQAFDFDLTQWMVSKSIAVWGRVMFLDKDGKQVDGAKNSAVLYWNFRWYVEVDKDGKPTVKPRLDTGKDSTVIDRLRKL
jgi:hypothetical protein